MSLWSGYVVMRDSILPTAHINVRGGLHLDSEAHARLITSMQETASDAAADLTHICGGHIANHGSDQQVSDWILSEVLGYPIRPPAPVKPISLVAFLRRAGGLAPHGDLTAMGAPVNLTGMSLEHATIAAWEAGYIGHEHDTMGDTRPEEHDLLEALDRELRGDPVYTIADQMALDTYTAVRDDFHEKHVEDEHRLTRFNIRLNARTNGAVNDWRTTKTGNLGLRRGSSLRKAEALADTYPTIAEYLVARVRWRKAQKLVDAFGPTLRRWNDGVVRGQHRVYGAWTGRQSCADPNLQNQPHDEAFRACWIATPGRKLIIADYSQIELRLLAIEAHDERLMEVYRAGRDVHQETADIAGIPRKNAKNVNFAMAYGSGAAGLSENFGFSLDESRSILARVLGAYPGLARYREQAPARARSAGYIAIRPNRRVTFTAESPATTAINAPIQGGAASVQNRALTLIHRELSIRPWLDAHLAAAVHDEIILDSHADDAAHAAEILVDGMTRALIEIYPEAEPMGLARLTAAAPVDRWSEKA